MPCPVWIAASGWPSRPRTTTPVSPFDRPRPWSFRVTMIGRPEVVRLVGDLGRVLGEGLLDEPVPAANAVWSRPSAAEQAGLTETGDGAAQIAGEGERAKGAGLVGHRRHVGEGRLVGVDEADLGMTRLEDREHLIGVAGPDGPGELLDGRNGSAVLGQLDDVAARPEPADEVGEDRAGLDRGELVGVADEEQTRRG